MKRAMQVKPISYLMSHAAEVVKDVSSSGQPLTITQDGNAKVVVVDAASYEKQEETLALLKLLVIGKREMVQARYQDADEFFAELNREDHA